MVEKSKSEQKWGGEIEGGRDREKSGSAHQIVEHKNGILDTAVCKVKTRVRE